MTGSWPTEVVTPLELSEVRARPQSPECALPGGILYPRSQLKMPRTLFSAECQCGHIAPVCSIFTSKPTRPPPRLLPATPPPNVGTGGGIKCRQMRRSASDGILVPKTFLNNPPYQSFSATRTTPSVRSFLLMCFAIPRAPPENWINPKSGGRRGRDRLRGIESRQKGTESFRRCFRAKTLFIGYAAGDPHSVDGRRGVGGLSAVCPRGLPRDALCELFSLTNELDATTGPHPPFEPPSCFSDLKI